MLAPSKPEAKENGRIFRSKTQNGTTLWSIIIASKKPESSVHFSPKKCTTGTSTSQFSYIMQNIKNIICIFQARRNLGKIMSFHWMQTSPTNLSDWKYLTIDKIVLHCRRFNENRSNLNISNA